jgi:hypothetical protein
VSRSRRKLAKRRVDADALVADLVARGGVAPLHLTFPDYVLTSGPEVVDINAEAGFYADPEQAMLLDLIFAIDDRGKSAAFEVDVIAARQNIKTGLILMAELGWLFVTEENLIVHSAHELDTTGEAFIDLRNLITSTSVLSRRLAGGPSNGIYEGNGQWRIELADGRRIKYKARTKGGGRGLTGDKVVLDEGFALLPTHMGALLPTLAAVYDPQVLQASSAGKAESAILRDKRDRGIAGLTARQVYAAWGDPNPHTGCLREDCRHEKTAIGCALDDEARWASAMTSALGRRIELETIRSFRQAMPPEEFAREFLVWFDEGKAEVGIKIDGFAWARLARPDARKPRRVWLYVASSPDGSSTSIGAAGDGEAGRTLVLTTTAAGQAWVVGKLKRMLRKQDVAGIVLNSNTQAGSLVAKLKAASIDFVDVAGTEDGLACVGMTDAITEGTVEHVGQPELDMAVSEARTRRVGEGERFDQRDPEGPDISPLIAAAGARHRWVLEADYDVEDSYL